MPTRVLSWVFSPFASSALIAGTGKKDVVGTAVEIVVGAG